METDQTNQQWMQYFQRAAATCTGLGAADIEEMTDALMEQWVSLSLEDVAEDEIERKLVELTDRLLKNYCSSFEQANAVVAKLAAPKAVATTHSSVFPVTDISSTPAIVAPLERLEALMKDLLDHGDYNRIRDEYCRLSIALNLERSLAPAYRPELKTGRKWGDKVFQVINRDRIVIECHWLHATKAFVKVRAKDVEFQPIFSHSKAFPFDLAWDFAKKVWTANHRVVDMLRLTPMQQCQLLALRSDELKQRIEEIEQGTRKNDVFIPSPLSVFEQRLNAWCERDRRIYKHREGYVAVWKARSFLGAAATVRQIGELTAMMLGEPPKDDKTIRSREVNIHRHILGD